ncbi:MAG TPA: GNAT family N-acetyltransferase [Patescibacteria group bacterium]|nr:GNAT family N-acetyltransferase [Patescibacteria group bacterium]
MRKIVYNGKTKTEKDIIIRYPLMEDLTVMTDFINILSREQTYIIVQGRQWTIEEEKEFLTKQLYDIEKRKTVHLLVFCSNVLIGSSTLQMKSDALAHEGVFDITIAKEYRGQGIGKLLMQCVLDEGMKILPDLKIVTLGIFGDNFVAKSMYEAFGFTEFGRLPKGVLHKGNYVDHVYLYKTVKDI